MRMGLVLAMLLGAGTAKAEPLIGPWPVADPTEVLVLGTPHLSGIQHIQQPWLGPLLDRLAAWKPQVIMIEGLSGPECFLLRAYQKSWPETADDYCRRILKLATLGGTASGLDMPVAEAAAEKAVAALTPASTPAERRRMAMLFAAAGNVGSAATQWLRLPADERRAGDGVRPELAQALQELSTLRNENYWVGAALAARLGLERLYPTDDHLSDRIQAEAPLGLGEALQAIWSGERPALAREAQRLEAGLKDGQSVLSYYRFMNRAEVGEASVRGDMGRAFVTESAAKHGRRYVAWWEARNLRQVAHIRAALGATPGTRGLVVVGATHKPYFDAYLGMMHEIRVTSAAQVLGK